MAQESLILNAGSNHVTGHSFDGKWYLRHEGESVMKVAWRDRSRKTKCGR